MLKCPQCGNEDYNNLSYVEDIPVLRDIKLVDGNLVLAQGLIREKCYENGKDRRFACGACGHEFSIAPNFTIDFV